jgi:hypothetical protein
VAAKGTTSETPTTVTTETRGALGGVSLFYPILVDCNLERSDAPGGVGDLEPERFYDSAIQPVVEQSDEKLSIAVCLFSAGQKLKNVKIVKIDATYFVAVHHEKGHLALSSADRKNLLEQMASASAWPLFRALFVHMGSQTGMELPLLPNIPKLRWLKPDQKAEVKRKKPK